MRAVYFDNGTIAIRDVAKPRLKPGYALLKTRLAGICNTDLELLAGYYNFSGIPGHEFVADVVECDERRWIGKRVVGEINLACGACQYCAQGLGRHCPKRSVLGIVKHPGAFADYFTLPVENLLPVPNEMLDEYAVFTEPVAAACEILEQVPLGAQEEVAVLGDGKLGLLIAQVLTLSGCRVTAFGRNRTKLDVLKPLGIKTMLVKREAARYPTAAFGYVVEASGSAEGLNTALRMVRPRGTVVLKSTVHNRAPFDSAQAIVNEITLVGSRCGRFAPAMKWIRSGELNLGAMIDAWVPLEHADIGLGLAREPGILKVLLST
ncbi:MAG: alcohol dehydrogenase catalytic domain-containing protein [Bryobacter sp.]|nr:alcohol dehydrogenase catalytic domain-containing protein [Bryobacter sp.]